MPGDRVVGTGCAALDYIPSRYNVLLLPSGSSHENALVGTQCVKVVSQSVSQSVLQDRRFAEPRRAELDVVALLFCADGERWLLVVLSQEKGTPG